ncbi:DUF1768-domain-containing protein [Karstenula rhodostoma CBS 690.94]|uniref:DUF1768-domain-containing protein n=1 Tax=Karstenula rhodostoma CBS 690.94 TaxID=1392251 RepID=A0A9P4PHD1_9PLEO|nr:DUF1768-domain-containing protein [Karstenula rhodostoma CBS 690.94]
MAESHKAQPQSRRDGPVYFWKPEQEHGYLGQWFRSPWTHEGDTYKTAEMWMMVGKARLFEDEDVAQEILAADNPRKQKALGRKVRDFDEKVWNKNRMRIVEEGNYYKFTISEGGGNLRAMLFATGERELVEASPMDRIWGVGFAEKNAGQNRARWGQNLLGKALMNVRARLREESAQKGKTEGGEEKKL